MNTVERHFKKVNKVHSDINTTLGSVANLLVDLNKHKQDIINETLQNNKIIEEVTSVNARLADTLKDLNDTIAKVSVVAQK